MKFEPIKVALDDTERRPFLYLLHKWGTGPGWSSLVEVANGHPVTEAELEECRSELTHLDEQIEELPPDVRDEGDQVCITDCTRDLAVALRQLRALRQITENLATLAERAITTRGQHG